MRYLLQRVLTNQWLTRDFDGLSDAARTNALNGPGSINGTLQPEWRDRIAPDGKPYMLEWGTIIYAVDGNRILNAGIVEKIDYDGDALTVEAPSYCRYPNGLPYSEATNFGAFADPFDVVRALWANVQSKANSNLGVIVQSSPLHLPPIAALGDNANPYGLLWWDNVDIGGEIDNLARQGPFDYTEKHLFGPGQQTVTHIVQMQYPRLGRKRTDLRFAEGENIIDKVPVPVAGDEFANELIGIGRGEGSAMIHATVGVVDGRLRRAKILTDKAADKPRLDALLATHLQKLRNDADITQVTIRDHANARLSAINLGDDICVQATIPWLGPIAMWVRVLAITQTDADETTAVLSTRRSDSFIYSTTTEVSA
jgi:hypothetical protein